MVRCKASHAAHHLLPRLARPQRDSQRPQTLPPAPSPAPPPAPRAPWWLKCKPQASRPHPAERECGRPCLIVPKHGPACCDNGSRQQDRTTQVGPRTPSSRVQAGLGGKEFVKLRSSLRSLCDVESRRSRCAEAGKTFKPAPLHADLAIFGKFTLDAASFSFSKNTKWRCAGRQAAIG